MKFEALPAKRYPIIYADPPWRYARLQSCGTGPWTNGAVSHYPTVAHGELCKLPVESIAANDCLLFLWAASPLLDEAIQLGKAWAFQYKTVGFVWFIEGAGWWNAIAILKKGRYSFQHEWHSEEYYKLQHKRADKFLLYVLSVCHDLVKRDALYKGAFSACVGQPVFGVDDKVVKVDDVIAPPGGVSK